MRAKVLSACRNELSLQAGDHVVCALSGGADSVALLHCLLSLQEQLQITVSAAHFNHCLRGEESDSDEAFVRSLCARWNVNLAVGRGDPRQRTGESPEEAARKLRYDFLLAQPGLIATAHHGDDQVETILLNLLRGTGLKGLCGMPPRQGRLLRPMLEVSQEEVLAYAEAHGLPFCTDRTNHEDDALRNRLRHHVTPLLRQENPNLTETVCRMTKLLRQDEMYLQQQTEALLTQAKRDGGYDCSTLLDAPAVLRRRAIRRLLEIPKPAMVHVEQVDQLLTDLRGSASIQLPDGMVARREYDLLKLERLPVSSGFSPITLYPGQDVLLQDVGLHITMKGPVFLEKDVDFLSTFAIKCDMMVTAPAVTVRPRQTGDLLQLPGGRKRIKKLMIDRKIPASQRDRLPVLADEQGAFAVYQLGCDVTRQAQPGDRAWIFQFHNEERYRDVGKNEKEN